MPAVQGNEASSDGTKHEGVARSHRQERVPKYARSQKVACRHVLCNPTLFSVLAAASQESSGVPSREEAEQGLSTMPVRVALQAQEAAEVAPT